jgi:assimilatory nitrate reductase catalytic subunit
VASTREITHATADYFATAIVKRGWRAELAGVEAPADWTAFARRTLALGDDADVIAYHDAAAGQRRFAAFHDGAFVGALFASPGPAAVARSWIVERLGERVAPAERLGLLLGRPGAEARDRGPIVCACLDVGRNEILKAAADLGEAATVAAIGTRLKAGANCGSCRDEIAKLIAPTARRRAR